MTMMMQDSGTSSPADSLLAQRDAEAKEKAVLEWVQTQYKSCRSDRLKVERQWYINLAFYFGKQNIKVIAQPASSDLGFALVDSPAPPYRVRLVINKIRPIIRHQISKLTSQKPMFTVVPLTSDDDDIVAAQVGEKIFNAEWSNKDLPKTIRQTVWWTALTGCGYIKCYWDPEVKLTGAGAKNASLFGDIIYDRVDPFHVFVPDLIEEEIEKQAYVIHATTLPLEFVKARYGTDAATVPSTDDILGNAYIDLIKAKVTQKKQEVLCLEVWVKPGKIPMFPEGALISVVGEQLINITPTYPYTHGMYPFAKIDDIPTGGFYHDSIINDLIMPQREYNKTRSQLTENKNQMSRPQLLAIAGSIDPRRITNEPGQVIEVLPGFSLPQPLPIQPIPQYVITLLQMLGQDMDDLSGQHEISRGSNPSQITAATAISYLQEQDDTKLAVTVASIEEAVQKCGRLCLGYVSQFWDQERLVRIAGSDSAFESMYYKGKDLGGNTDVRVEAGSALPMSKAAKQAFIMDSMKNGLIPPDMGMDMLGIAGIDKIYEDLLVDRRQAKRENLKMSMGIQVTCNDWDNHGAHIVEHNRYRKTQQYEMLDPTIQATIGQHVDQHKMFQMQAAQTAMLQAGANLTPPGQGQAPMAPAMMPGQQG